MVNRKFSVCIVSHNGYGAISGGNKGFIGGVEWQTSVLARWLAQRGHRVTFVTWNEGGPPDEVIDGVRVLKLCGRNDGLPGLRFFHPKWTNLVQALRRTDADVYYHNCGDCVTGQMALWCAARHKPLVFYLSSNADADPSLPELKTWRERYLYRRGISLATAVLSQTRSQQRALLHHFGRSSEIMPMPCQGPAAHEFALPDPACRRILWVGRVCAIKRPELFLDLAGACPEFQFVIAGPLYQDEPCRRVRERAERIPNLTLLGQVAKQDLPALYCQAAALCCTSKYEGFPNTFLEAWSHGLPIVSTFDPDGVIAGHGLGLVAKSGSELRVLVQRLLGSAQDYARMSQAVRAYFLRHHTVDAVLPRLEEALWGVTRGSCANSVVKTVLDPVPGGRSA